MPWLDGGWKWMVLATGLYFLTFGGDGLLVVLYALVFIGGGFMITYSSGQNVSTLGLAEKLASLARPNPCITKVKVHMENTTKIRNFDKRMTGSSVIDDVLQEVLQYTIRDYIKTWYRQISEHDGFLLDIHHFVQKVVITFSSRSKEIDWMPYFTQRLVDDFASHIRLFRRVSDKIAALPKEEREKADIVQSFFDLEVDMENNMCRDEICLSPDAERQYLQDLVEVILFLLLPKEDFYNKPFRYIIREVVVNGIFIPTIDLLSDPDYINQYIAWMCDSSSFSKETFLTVIKSSDSLDELEAVRDMVEQEITRWRAKDSGGIDDALIKQNLNSLRFLKDTCEARRKRLQFGPTEGDQMLDEPDFLKYQNLYVLTLDDIIGNNIALQTFIEFLTEKGGQQYLYFYLNVEGFRAAAEHQISEAHRLKENSRLSIEPDLESLRRAASIIFDQYLSEKASSRIKVESDLSRLTIQKIKSKMLSEDVFDSVQTRVYQILHNNFYEEFLQTNAYIKLLGELGLLPDSKSDDGDTLSLDDDDEHGTEQKVLNRQTIQFLVNLYSYGFLRSERSRDQSPSLDQSSSSHSNQCTTTGISVVTADEPVDVSSESSPDTRSLDSLSSTSSGGTPYSDLCVAAHISQSGIVKEAGKSYAIFAITVRKRISGSDDEDICDVYRRYSDFHDLNMLLIEKFPEMVGPRLPGKTVIKNTSKEFLDKRRRALDRYLKAIMKLEMWQKFPGMEELVLRFLAPGLWEKHKSELARKMDTIVNPLRTSMKTVGHAVRGIDGIIRNNDIREDLSMSFSGKVSAALHGSDAEENIPLRIMLLMMNEVFDLRHKNQWLRRRIVAILRQLLKATFGDMINRKIVDHVDWMTSAEQMAEYVKAFRDSFWPMGILAEPRLERELHTVMRTRVLCKAKMLGSIPDEMRHLMGTDTIQTGVDRVFKMFQLKHLNKRLLYVFLEGVLETLFPTNKLPALFRKLHSKSKRVREGGREKRDSFSDPRIRPARR